LRRECQFKKVDRHALEISVLYLKEEDLLDLITAVLKVKGMSTRGPGRGDTCHLTDFSETWPD